MSPSAARRARDQKRREHIGAGTSVPKPTPVRRTTTAEIRDVVVSEIRDMRVQIEEHRKHVSNVSVRSKPAIPWVAELDALLP